MATDIEELRKEFLRKNEAKRDQIKDTFKDLLSAHGEYSIKTERLISKTFIEKTQELLKHSDHLFEFSDTRHSDNPRTNIPKELKNKNITLIYNPINENYTFEIGKKIKLYNNYNHANIISFNNIATFTTINKETLFIENEEIARTIQFLIRKIHDTKNSATN